MNDLQKLVHLKHYFFCIVLEATVLQQNSM